MSRSTITTAFISIVSLLVLGGLFILTSASMILGRTNFGDPYYYVKQQILKGLILGIVGFCLAFLIPYKKYKKLIPLFFIASIILTILVFTPLGLEINNARRWLELGFLSFQPAEFLKVCFILYLSLWLSHKNQKEKNSITTIIAFISMLAVIGAIMLLQHATSSYLILAASAGIVFFVSGVKLKNIFIFFLIIIVLLASFFIILKKVNPNDYRIQRIDRFISFFQNQHNPEIKDAQDKNYQLTQSLMAIGSGGLKGVGFGNAVSKYNNYLPEPIGDSIFAIFAQEFGLIGCFILILLYLLLLLFGLKISLNTSDEFAKLASFGIVSLILIQTFVHIGAISGLLVLTGQPLPLISYGGTNLAIILTSLGIVANISKNG
ncbi:MAG: FtsW/RodA/SpoVE family cell cycle protein [Minisyncoccia bacterium]